MASRRDENRKLVRAFIGMAAAIAGAFAAFAVPFWVPASWNGAIGRFGELHPVLEITLGVSVLLFGSIPTAVGAFSLVMPDTEVSVYGTDRTMAGAVRTGSRTMHTSRREAAAWIIAGCTYAAIIGVVIYVIAR